MENLTKTDSLEYANRGIRVNAIAPGATMSTTGVAAAPMNQAWKDEDRKKAMSSLRRATPTWKVRSQWACWFL